MSNIRRYYIPNAFVFITAVTREMYPFLGSDKDVDLFWETLRNVQAIYPFHLLAYVILPDHFHWIMRVDDETGNFSRILHSLKRNYTLNYKSAHGIIESLSVWQRRFWDHVIRDERDLESHFDYIHWNPVRHGVALYPDDWRHSSFSHWYGKGLYEEQWGQSGEPSNIVAMNLE